MAEIRKGISAVARSNKKGRGADAKLIAMVIIFIMIAASIILVIGGYITLWFIPRGSAVMFSFAIYVAGVASPIVILVATIEAAICGKKIWESRLLKVIFSWCILPLAVTSVLAYGGTIYVEKKISQMSEASVEEPYEEPETAPASQPRIYDLEQVFFAGENESVIEIKESIMYTLESIPTSDEITTDMLLNSEYSIHALGADRKYSAARKEYIPKWNKAVGNALYGLPPPSQEDVNNWREALPVWIIELNGCIDGRQTADRFLQYSGNQSLVGLYYVDRCDANLGMENAESAYSDIQSSVKYTAIALKSAVAEGRLESITDYIDQLTDICYNRIQDMNDLSMEEQAAIGRIIEAYKLVKEEF